MINRAIARQLRHLILALGLVILVFMVNPPGALAQPNPADLSKAVEEIEHLDAMRSGLAATLQGKSEQPTLQTMKQVCRPVGQRAMQLSQENGWQVKQVAAKYRNPAHAPGTLHDRMALAKFQQDPQLTGFWDRETINGQTGTHYYRRINVEQSCLACHGSQERRPDFVKENYPQDLAYNFQVGDLRGMYSVFIPDVKATLQKALQ